MKILINGKDNLGWSVDMDRKNIQNSLKRLKIQETEFWLTADIIHNVWWNTLLNPKAFHLKLKRNILATTSNFINLENENYDLRNEFERARKIAKAWIVPSTKQKKIFDLYSIRSYYLPFYLDLSVFKPLRDKISRAELSARFQINSEIIKNRVIIGSFQRDTLGSELNKPKWQKGPELLIELLKELPKDKFVLLLAGPRRHYVIKECKKYGIPYYYIGNATYEDDIELNSLSIEKMPYLYNLTDIYLVTSVSEGGPKAILEATSTKTFIFSTNVGLANDFLEKHNIFSSEEEYKKSVTELVNQFQLFKERIQRDIEQQYKTSIETLSYSSMDKQLLNIYTNILSKK